MNASPLQEIICCIGHEVSPNPTQYVMERAFAAAALDYRCLTLDVTPDDLAAAMDGMRAMGFRGAIMAPPHETEVAKYLDTLRGVANRARFVDLVCRDDGRLVGECVLSASVLEHAEAALGRFPQAATILGDDARALAIAEGLASAGAATTMVRLVPDDADKQTGSSSASEAESAASMRCVGRDEFSFEDSAPDLVVCCLNDDHVSAWRLDVDWFVGANERTCAALDLSIEAAKTRFLGAALDAGCLTVNGVEIQLTTLLKAFVRWTETEADEQIMREALEEFLLV